MRLMFSAATRCYGGDRWLSVGREPGEEQSEGRRGSRITGDRAQEQCRAGRQAGRQAGLLSRP